MKTYQTLILTAALAGCLAGANAQQADPPEKKQPADPATPPPVAPGAPAGKPAPSPGGEEGLRLNFRGAPLDMVLSYLSDAAGFIIVLETEVKGTVDVWSNQPLSKDEAVELLNTVLGRNGYAAIRNGRTLKIVSREEAKTKDVPVRSGSDPQNIVKSDEMVTQVIPVRYANAAQLIMNLQPLLPSYARDSFTANESGNSLVLTASQTDVRRMVEIVRALDDSISGISTIRVFQLRYADAKELATAVKELFPSQATQAQGGNRGGNTAFGGPGNPFGGGGGGGGRGGRNAAATTVTAKVIAVADEHSNALIVSAPEDALPTIEKLVSELDVVVADVTELRVFHLLNSDPLEMVDIFTQLFPDDTSSNGAQNQPDVRFNRGGGQRGIGGQRGGFGGFGGFGGLGGLGNRNAAQTTGSERAKKKGRVLAVADQRTSSLIVSAASELMPQIEEMIAQLDGSPAKKQKVFVYSLENADVQQVEQIVRNMFERTTTANRNNGNQNSPLLNRSQGTQNGNGGQMGINGNGFGNGNQNGGRGQGQGFP
jgi:type II secretory pathway component GspD/PulD (secretin)